MKNKPSRTKRRRDLWTMDSKGMEDIIDSLKKSLSLSRAGVFRLAAKKLKKMIEEDPSLVEQLEREYIEDEVEQRVKAKRKP